MGKWARVAIGLGELKVRDVKELVESGRSELGLRDDSRDPYPGMDFEHALKLDAIVRPLPWIIGGRIDGPTVTETVQQFVDPITIEYARQTDQQSGQITEAVTETEDIANLHNERVVRRQVAVEVAADASIPNIAAPFLISKEQGIPGSVVKRWIDRNISLIKVDGGGLVPPIPKQHFAEMRRILDLGIRRNTNHVDIARALRDLDGVTARRARTIAVDQVNKHSAAMSRTRHNQMDFRTYFWNNQGDQKVRPDHRARQGIEFEYAKPPPDGHPGQPVRCRCWAQANVRRALGLSFEPPSRTRTSGSPAENAISLAKGKVEQLKRTLRSAARSVKEARRVSSGAPRGSQTAAKTSLTRAEGFRSKAERSLAKAEARLKKLG